jgi:hypothetical protein
MVEPRRKRAPLVVGADGIEQELERLRRRLRSEGAVKLSTLKPRTLRDDVARRLVCEGFEVAGSFVRRPLSGQLRDAVSGEQAIAVSALPGRVRGASRSELEREVAAAAARGDLQRVARGGLEFVVGPSQAVLGGQRLENLYEALCLLTKMLAVAGKKKNVGVLASDVEPMLSAATHVLEADRISTPQPASGVKRAADVAPNPDAPRSPPGTPVDALAYLLAALDAACDERTGLSFVPAIVQRLSPAMTVSVAHDVLLSAARRELIELRPEGGLARLSAEELALCPPGPAGTRLSWARRGSGAAV